MFFGTAVGAMPKMVEDKIPSEVAPRWGIRSLYGLIQEASRPWTSSPGKAVCSCVQHGGKHSGILWGGKSGGISQTLNEILCF